MSVLLSTMVPAFSIWLLKNSPKFFIYMRTLLASATVTALFNSTSISEATSLTAFITSESLPTPDGSMITRSGVYFVSTSARDFPKSPTREQQMQPEFISRISIPASFKKPPSIPISPNSFSIRTTFSPEIASFNRRLIKVVFPAPRKPEIISIFVISIYLLFCNYLSEAPGFSQYAATKANPSSASVQYIILTQNPCKVNRFPFSLSAQDRDSPLAAPAKKRSTDFQALKPGGMDWILPQKSANMVLNYLVQRRKVL